MASSYEAFKELDLSRDEVEKLETALKEKEFRKLLVDYVEELQDPENRKIYENEIIQLEKERGIDVKFVNPVAGYVIKTSVDGCKKCFVNICSNEIIEKPSSSPKVQEGSKGLQWSLPHTITPVREDIDNKGARCVVYDVVFHPDTLHLGQNNKAFRNMVNSTACNAIETNFDVKLDKRNLKFPKLQYKGYPHAAVIRKPSKETPTEKPEGEQLMWDKIYASIPKSETKTRKKTKKSNKVNEIDDMNLLYTTPKFVIKHRSNIEMEEFTEHKNSKLNSAIPKELVVEINLPLLKSASDIVLDVAEKSLHLKSEKPSKYKLALTLPYHVNQDNGNAKFDKDSKQLIITLPVKRNMGLILTQLSREDSGVESDQGSPIREDCLEVLYEGNLETLSAEKSDDVCDPVVSDFLNPNLNYSLPEYTCHMYENTIAFTLNVKNVSEHSVEKVFSDVNESVHVKFTNISSGFYPIYYALYVKLLEHVIDVDKVSIETWDNNVILQLPYKPCDKLVKRYLIGTSAENATEKYVDEPSVLNNVLTTPEINVEEKKHVQISECKSDSNDSCLSDNDNNLRDDEEEGKHDKHRTKAISIVGTVSESSGDELSCSFSPSKGRGILKRLSGPRQSVSRSISESSIDGLMWTSSFENCHTSMDSVIPEDGEVSTSLKKTVRFSNVISKQLFR